MISKELLSAVTGMECSEGRELYGKWSNKIEFSISKHNHFNYAVKDTINIYELAYKCKKWALKNNVKLWSILDSYNSAIVRINEISKREFYSHTEPDAIFKACEWILENKDKK